nr:helix-turn-helix domain-containing protein [Ornithinimicrobium sp. HY1745]
MLREARKAKGWTQQDLAEMAGVTRQWVIGIEAGAPTARVGLVLDVLRCVDLLVDIMSDDTDTFDVVLGDGLDD